MIIIIFIIFVIAVNSSYGLVVCNPKNFNIQIPNVIELFSKAQVSLSHDNAVCAKDAKYHWNLYMIAETDTLIEGVFLNNENGTKNVMSLSNADKKLQFYKYEFKIVVNLIPSDKNYIGSPKEVKFRVTPKNMKLLIEDGTEKEFIFGCGDLIIDASRSNDPSFWPSVHPMNTNTIKWNCVPPDSRFKYQNKLILKITQWVLRSFVSLSCTMTVTRKDTPFFPETASVSQLIKIVKLPPPNLRITCEENCNPSDASKEIVLKWECISNCMDNLPKCRSVSPSWSIRPLNSTIVSLMKKKGNDKIRFPNKVFKSGSSVTFLAYLGTGMASLTITFRIKTPILIVLCKTNCGYDIARPVIFKVSCSTENDCNENEYIWETSPAVDFKLNDAKDEITIPEYKLENNDLLTVNVKALNTSSSTNAIMKEFIPQFVFSCIVEKSSYCSEYVDPNREIEIIIKCNCTGDFTYIVRPKPNQRVNMKKDSIGIPQNTYKHGDQIEVTAYAGRYNKSFVLKFKEVPVKLDIECTQNCDDPANTYIDTIIFGHCQGCHGRDFTWQISRLDPTLVQSWTFGYTITIPAQTFHDNETVSFSIHMGSSNFTLKRLYVEPLADLSILCEINCLQTDPFLETGLKVVCSSEYGVCSSLKYNWQLRPMPIQWKTKLKYEENTVILKIKEGAYKDDDIVNVNVTGRKSSASMKLRFKEPVPKLFLECIEHCDPSHPAFRTKFKVTCKVNCRHISYKWNINKVPETFDWFTSTMLSDDKSIITINEGTFKDGDSKEVIVTSGKGSAKLLASFKDIPPVIKINCQPSCNITHNPLNPLSIWVNCTKYCFHSFNFSWSFKNAPKKFDFAKSVITQINSESILILPDAFANGTNIAVVVESGNSTTSELLKFYEPNIELDIICDDNCNSLNSFIPNTLIGQCLKHCTHVTSFSWNFKPLPPSWLTNITSAPFNKSVIIHAETYKEGDDVEVKLLVRNSSMTRKIHFSEFISNLSMHCLASCSQANPFDDVDILVTCDQHCDKIEYVWDVKPLKKDFNFSKHIVLGKGNESLKIIKNSFNDSNTLKVSVSNRKAKAEQTIHFVEPIARLNITCVKNCENGTADPLENIVLEVKCIENCYRNNYTWVLKPPPAKQNWTSGVTYGEQNITIKGDLYRDKGSVRIVVSNYKGEAHQDIYFIEPTPDVVLSCPDCSKPNPDKSLTLYAHCKTCDHHNFTWEISPQPRNFSWANNVKFGLNNESIVIVKNTFKNYENVSVILKNGKGKSRLDFGYEYPPAFLNISCVENCFPANPYRKVMLNVTCLYDCGVPHYQWKISPLPEGFNWNKNVTLTNGSQLFTLAPDSFQPNQTINITVFTNSLHDSISIHFKKFDPDIKLKCKENCLYNPKRALSIETICNDYCEHLTFEWDVEPKSNVLNWLKIKENNLYIKAKSYEDKNNILVSVRVGPSASNMSIIFHLPDFDGDCFIEPSSGVSGETLFAIDCEEFADLSLFRLYQNFSSSERNYSVLLAYGQHVFIDNLLLSETRNSHLTMIIGKGWETKRELSIPVEVSSFPKGINSIKNVLFGMKGSDYSSFLRRKLDFRSIQLASALSTALETVNVSNTQHYIHHIISGVIFISPRLEPLQCISILIKIGIKLVEDPLTAKLLMEGGRITSQKMNEKATNSYTKSILKEFSEDVLWLASKLLTLLHAKASLLENTNISPDYPMYPDFLLPAADIKKNIQAFTIDFLSTINTLIQIVHKSGETMIESNEIIINVINVSEKISDHYLKSDATKTYIRVTERLHYALVNNKIPLLYQYVNFKINPFWWEDSVNKINTEIIQLTIEGVTILPDLIHVYLSKLDNPSKVLNGETTESTVFEFSLTEKSLFSVEFEIVDSPYSVSIGSCMPGSKKFNDKLHIINESKLLSVISQKSYIYIGINPINNKNIKYQYKVAAYDCFYWSSSDLAWSKQLCYISNEQQPDLIHCICKHLSYFGGRTYIPEIKSTASIKETLPLGKIAKDYTILVSVIIAAVIFLILLYIAHRNDLSLYKKNKVQFVDDNIPGDEELYLILVATGISINAQTTASVAIKIIGKLGQSRVHILSSKKNQLLKRNSEVFFVIYAEKYLGDLKSIKLWHNSRGRQPHWFCERIIIKHPKSRQEYIFYVQRWFSLIYGDGTTKGTFHASNMKVMKFNWKLRESIRECHHILSFYSKRPRRGTSKQTILIGFASCVTVMLATMILLKRTEIKDTTTRVVIGTISAIISIPITAILGWLFKNAR